MFFFVVFDPTGVSSRLSNDEVHGLLNLESRKASAGFLYSLTPRKDCFKFCILHISVLSKPN